MHKNPIKPKGFNFADTFKESLNGNGQDVQSPETTEPDKSKLDFKKTFEESLKKKDGGVEPATTSTPSTSQPEAPLPSQENNVSRENTGASVFDNPKLQNIPIPDFTSHDDPIGQTLNDLQTQRQGIIDKNLRSDNTSVSNFHPIVNIGGKSVAVTKGGDEVNNLDNQIQGVKENTFSDPTTAGNYLKTRLNGKQVALKKGNHDDIGLGHQTATVTPESDLNLFDTQSLKDNLNPNNTTEQLAFDRVKKQQNVNNALATSSNLNEAAIKYWSQQVPTVGKQVAVLQNSGEKLPDAYAGQLVSNFLDNPDLVRQAQSNPDLAQSILQTKANLYNDYPTFGKRVVAQKISQEREDLNLNNSVINIPTQESTDKVVDDMYKAGKLNDSERAVYEKSIRPSLGVMNSIGRGVGRLIPGVQAAVDESPIATPGFFENAENSYVNTLHGMAHSLEDIPSAVNLGETNAKRLSNALQNDWSAVSIDPKNAWHELGQSTGNMTGFVLPMIMGGEATSAIGASGNAGELITNGLIFESQNKDKALTEFPDNPGKQFLYTTLSTAGDMMLGKLIPTKEAQEGVSNLLKTDIGKVVNQFSDGEITAAAARNTILEKATKYVGDVVKGNIHTGTAMAGFGLLHNGLDAAFGGRDVDLGDVANDAIQNFKAGFLGGTVISAFAANAGNAKLNGDVMLEMASNPEHYKEVIENQAKLNPDLLPTKDEKISNLNTAALINKDLEGTDLDSKQKGQYLIQALNQKIWENKAENANNEVLKNDYLSKAKESEKIQKNILAGKGIQSTEDLKAKEKFDNEILNAKGEYNTARENYIFNPTTENDKIISEKKDALDKLLYSPKTNTNEESNSQKSSSQSGSQKSNAEDGKENGSQENDVNDKGVVTSDETTPLIQAYRDKTGVTKEAVSDEDLLKNISEQAQNISGGEENKTGNKGDLYKNTVAQTGSKELVDAAIKAHPTESLLNKKEPDEIKVSELIDKPITYKGEKARLYQDGQAVVAKIDGKNKEYELGNIDEVKDKPISDFGIGHETSVVSVTDAGDIKVRNDEYKNNYSDPLAAINRDKDGNIVSVNLETPDGKKRTFRGNIAEDIAYQIHLKEINKNNETRNDFENFINSDPATTKEINDNQLSETTAPKATENNEQVPREKVEPKQSTVVSDKKPLTKEAQDLLNGLSSGSKPTFITKNLEKIANDNGIEITGKMSADDVINALKEKSNLITTKEVIPETNGTNEKTNPENKQTDKQAEETKPNNTAVSENAQPTEGETKVKEPPKPPVNENADEDLKNKNTSGVSHRALTEVAKRLGLKEPERGTVLSPKEYADRGKLLIEGGVDPQTVADQFKEDGKISPDIISVARAHAEDLLSNLNKAADDFGENSKEYKEAEKEYQDWQDEVVKPMGTKAGATFTSLQGVRDIDTGSFHALKTYFRDENNKEATPNQLKQIKSLSETVKDLTKKFNDVVKKLDNALSKNKKNEKETGKPTREKLSTQLSDIAKRLRTSSEFDDFLAGAKGDVQKSGIDLPKLKEIAASILEDAAKAVKLGENAIDYIRKAVEGLKEDIDKEGLINSLNSIGEKTGLFSIKETTEEKNIKRLEKQLQDLKDEVIKSKSEKRDYSEKEKELKNQIEAEKDRIKESDLVTQFAGKKDNKFTPEEAKDIWEYAKKNYLDKGEDFNDTVTKTSTDLGLTPNQVIRSLEQQKGVKPITDELYRKQRDRRLAIAKAENYVKTANNSKAAKFLRAIPSFFFRLSTFGHGTVGFITHAGTSIFNPLTWRQYWPLFFRQFKLAYGNIAHYEKAMADMKRDPAFIPAVRAGLAVDPDKVYDDYQTPTSSDGKKSIASNIGNFLKKVGQFGDRGFNVLKLLRLELYKNEYNKLSDAEKSDPDTAKTIASIINHGTGVSEVPLPKAANSLFFAAKLEGSRWARLITQPAKAIATFANWKNATPAEKAGAKIVAKRAASIMATYTAMLAANQAILSASGSQQKVNFTDPTKSDFLKFKVGGYTLDLSGGMISVFDFLARVTHTAFESQRDLKKDAHGDSRGEVEGKQVVSYLSNKLSPFAGDVKEVATQHDFSGNTLPYSKDKPYFKSGHKLTWKEYLLSKAPIPLSAGSQAVFEQMHERGIDRSKSEQILRGILLGAMEGGTGARLTEEPKNKK